MLFSVLIYGPEEVIQSVSKEEDDQMLDQHRKFQQYTMADGSFAAATKLMPTETAVTLQAGEDDLLITDGPFADTKEQFLGFYLLDYPTLEEVIAAVRHLPFRFGRIEIRPVAYFNGADFKNAERVVIDAP